MKLGIIGLDCSHALAFSQMLNDPSCAEYIPGHQVSLACEGVTALDFDMSYGRMKAYAQEVRESYHVHIAKGIAEVMQNTEAVFLEQVDARLRVEQLKEILPYGKPVFVDKPFALSYAQAVEIHTLAQQYHTPLFSSSSLRYAQSLQAALQGQRSDIYGADMYGPMPIISVQPTYFWYGVHMADMLFETLGSDCVSVNATHTQQHDIITGVWRDGRLGVIRGNRVDCGSFGGTVYYKSAARAFDTAHDEHGYYYCLLQQILKLFTTGISPVSIDETVMITRFLQAANSSLTCGGTVSL